MPTARIHAGQVAIPAEVRNALGLHEGDQLEAHVVAGGVFFHRSPASADEVEHAWDELLAIVRRPKGEEPADARAQEEEIAAEIKAMRQRP